MVWSWRRSSRCADVEQVPAAAVALAPGERVLVRVRTGDESWVVGTDRALHLSDGAVLGWHQIDQARWLDVHKALEVVTLPAGSTPAMSYRIEIPVPGLLPELVRERVTSNIVASERVLLTGRAGARIVARRVPGEEGVRWSVIYDEGVPSSDPDVQTAARDAVARLRTRLGV